jgi:hypothetical protein
MNKKYVDDIISIVNHIIRKDPYDLHHSVDSWEIKKRTSPVWGISNVRCFHLWQVESNADADVIIETTRVKNTTDPNIDLKKVWYISLELL